MPDRIFSARGRLFSPRPFVFGKKVFPVHHLARRPVWNLPNYFGERDEACSNNCRTFLSEGTNDARSLQGLHCGIHPLLDTWATAEATSRQLTRRPRVPLVGSRPVCPLRTNILLREWPHRTESGYLRGAGRVCKSFCAPVFAVNPEQGGRFADQPNLLPYCF
jgi:hypothetical protein